MRYVVLVFVSSIYADLITFFRVNYLFLQLGLRARSHCAIFSGCDCDSSYRNKWVVQDSMEVFTLCDCDNITNSYLTPL